MGVVSYPDLIDLSTACIMYTLMHSITTSDYSAAVQTSYSFSDLLLCLFVDEQGQSYYY